jgi:hypothetical protein
VTEPLVVIALLTGGTWVNQNFHPGHKKRLRDARWVSDDVHIERHGRFGETDALIEDDVELRSASPSLLASQELK